MSSLLYPKTDRCEYKPWLSSVIYLPQYSLETCYSNKCRKLRSWDRNFSFYFQTVYTVGIRRADYGPDVADRLRSLGADFFTTNRGGLITFHGPGEKVVNIFFIR